MPGSRRMGLNSPPSAWEYANPLLPDVPQLKRRFALLRPRKPVSLSVKRTTKMNTILSAIHPKPCSTLITTYGSIGMAVKNAPPITPDGAPEGASPLPAGFRHQMAFEEKHRPLPHGRQVRCLAY